MGKSMELQIPKTILRREQHSREVLNRLQKRLLEAECSKRVPEFCVYATGSYGRLQAGKHSDIDVFLVRRSNKKKKGDKDIDAVQIKEIKKIFSDMGLAYTDEYLKVQYSEDILVNIGSRKDDFQNHFSARMCLILESQPLLNDINYRLIVNRTIRSYYRDFHDHERNFRPMFLTNDIVRFWKTLCLNYEQKRNIQSDDEVIHSKHHLRNLKLKFSRMLTCYATVLNLAAAKSVSQDEVIQLVQKPILEKLTDIAKESDEHRNVVSSMLDDYAWFLDNTDKSEDNILRWIGNRNNRDEAFERSRQFSVKMFDLIKRSTDDDGLRYLVI